MGTLVNFGPRVACRAQVSMACARRVQAELVDEDWTLDTATMTYVCDACYERVVAVTGLKAYTIDGLEGAIREVRNQDRNPLPPAA